jgi:hypothetical protein
MKNISWTGWRLFDAALLRSKLECPPNSHLLLLLFAFMTVCFSSLLPAHALSGSADAVLTLVVPETAGNTPEALHDSDKTNVNPSNNAYIADTDTSVIQQVGSFSYRVWVSL